jgi:hypothetical protein
MKLKYFILVFLLLLINNNSFSQKGKDKIINYKMKAIDRTAAYLCKKTEPPNIKYKIHNNIPNTNQIESEISNFSVGNKNFLKFLLGSNDEYQGIRKEPYTKSDIKEFPELIDKTILKILLDNKPERTKDPDFKVLKTYLDSLVIAFNKHPNSIISTDIEKNSDTEKKGLLDKLSLKSDSIKELNNQLNLKSDSINDLNNQIRKIGSKNILFSKRFFFVEMILIIIILFGGLVFYLFYYKENRGKLKKKNFEIQDHYNAIKNLDNENNKLNTEISNFKKKINEFESEKDKLNKEIRDLKLRVAAHMQSGINSPPSPPPPPPPPPIRYATSPDNPEGFSVSSLKPEKESRSIYKITFQNTDSATFEIVDDRGAISIALNNSGYILQPACEYENSPSDGENIRTLKAGKLIKSGNLWRIQEKALIKFI